MKAKPRKLDWNQLLIGDRRKPSTSSSSATESRIEIERDYDRLLFSTPVRRLADKTQVFPLERNDSVRTRLTHSYEVSNLARSIGTTLVYTHGAALGLDKVENAQRAVPALLAAVGLAHDLGNPPFGHQGEFAIRAWIKGNSAQPSRDRKSFDIFNKSRLSKAQKRDFEMFEGNAQAFRLLTKLQIINDGYGLNMSYAALSALMKYPVPSDRALDKTVTDKKFNFFQSEAEVVADVWAKTGLSEGVRHPLTFIMEACDDIAYSVLDLEDAAKKGLISFYDLIAWLKHEANGDENIKKLCQKAEEREKEYRGNAHLSGSELSDISMQMLRVHAIGMMVSSTVDAFVKNSKAIMSGTFQDELLEVAECGRVWKAFKAFAKKHVYPHRTVLEVELEGHHTIRGLMDLFWQAIINRKEKTFIAPRGADPFDAYVYSRISENYKRAAEMETKLPMRYRELQLMTDMISGMTDNFAIDLFKEFRKFQG